MGVPFDKLPKWEDIQMVTAQLWKIPLLDDAHVSTEVIIGPNAKTTEIRYSSVCI